MIGIQAHNLPQLGRWAKTSTSWESLRVKSTTGREKESIDIANTCLLGFRSMAGITRKSTQISVKSFWNFQQIFADIKIDRNVTPLWGQFHPGVQALLSFEHHRKDILCTSVRFPFSFSIMPSASFFLNLATSYFFLRSSEVLVSMTVSYLKM